jgi:hypothetical protein
MIKIRNESDFRNWFKENYHELGFSEIIESNSKCCPDFVMLEKGKRARIELEVKSSNFHLHGHSLDDVDKVICAFKDVELSVPIIEVKNVEVISSGKAAPYSFSELTYTLFEKKKILTASEVAKSLDINIGTADRALMELALDGKVERIKKVGVNLWMLR